MGGSVKILLELKGPSISQQKLKFEKVEKRKSENYLGKGIRQKSHALLDPKACTLLGSVLHLGSSP